MARVNERCYEHTPRELGIHKRVVQKGQEHRCSGEQVIDVRGAKTLTLWVYSDKNAKLTAEYLAEDRETILESYHLDLQEGIHNRFHFAIYSKELPFPAYFIRLVLNSKDEDCEITARGISQFQ